MACDPNVLPNVFFSGLTSLIPFLGSFSEIKESQSVGLIVQAGVQAELRREEMGRETWAKAQGFSIILHLLGFYDAIVLSLMLRNSPFISRNSFTIVADSPEAGLSSSISVVVV